MREKAHGPFPTLPKSSNTTVKTPEPHFLPLKLSAHRHESVGQMRYAGTVRPLLGLVRFGHVLAAHAARDARVLNRIRIYTTTLLGLSLSLISLRRLSQVLTAISLISAGNYFGRQSKITNQSINQSPINNREPTLSAANLASNLALAVRRGKSTDMITESLSPER